MITLSKIRKGKETEKVGGGTQTEEKKPPEEKPVKKIKKNYQKITKND